MDVLTILRAPLENYPPSLNQVALLAKAGLRVGVLELSGRLSGGGTSSLRPALAGASGLEFENRAVAIVRSAVGQLVEVCSRRSLTNSGLLPSSRTRLRHPGWRLCQTQGGQAPDLYYFHELPDPEAGEGLGPRLGRARAARFSREADLVVFSDAWRAQCYQQDVRLVKLPTVVMNCPMRMDTVPPSPLGELLAEQGKSGWKTVCYLGSVGWDQGVLEAAASMLWWPAQSLFVLIGPCSADIKQRLHQVAAEVGTADRLLFLGCRPHREALALAAGADIGIALIQPTTRNWLYSAGAINKRFEYMALGLAQITNTGPGVADIVEKGGCGRCVDARSPEAIGRDVCALLNSHTVRQDMARNSRSLHLDQFHYERQFEPVLGWIKTAVADSTRRGMSVPLPTPVSVLEPSGLLYGSELALLEILGALDPGAFQIEAVLPRAAPLAAHLRRSGVTCRELLGATTAKRSRWKRLLGYARLARHWFRHRPALVYVNQGGILRPAAAIARQLRIPVLCQVQTLEDARWVSRLTAQHHLVSTFVCNSQFIADHCTVPVGRRSTVYLGYKPKGLRRPLPLPSPCHGLLEVTVLGRVCEGKGHYFIVEAARLLKQANLRRFHFRFVGDAATPAEGLRIKTLVKRHRLTEWIEFRGYRDDVAAEFAATHLLAIPSFAEPFGRIFCEAAEAQVPVILADAGGLGELARHFNAGVRFPAGDVGAFIQCLQSIASNYDTVRNGFQTAGTRMLHSLDFSSYLNVIGDLMRRAANGAPVSVQWLGLGSRP